ncbi:MAG: RIP metalloprotease RseP [Bacteroidia bacterium]|nr:RIP metalloprotease RseP [Bacteroidia bacterium]GIV22744.1 MAG: zinc metalloprotease [Bacteroidia bacterium]
MLTLGLFLLALSLLILVHELGHFLPAKLFGMRVEKFYLFFDWPMKLWSWKRGGTEYGIGVLPLGGYVKIAGMVDESSLGKKAVLPSEPAPDEFRAKPLGQRALVIAGGPLMNILYAIGVLTVLFSINGVQRVPLFRWELGVEAVPLLGIQAGDRLLAVNGAPAYLDRVMAPDWLLASQPTLTLLRGTDTVQVILNEAQRDSLLHGYAQGKEIFTLRLPPIIEPLPGGPADKAGLKKGDKVLAINDTPVQSFSEMRAVISAAGGDSLRVLVQRARDTLAFSVGRDTAGRIQVFPVAELPQEVRKLSVEEAFVESFRQSYRLTVGNLKALFYLLTGKMRLSENVSGPIGIAKVAGRSYETGGWQSFWAFTAALSLILAVMNLLPIPLLDGGHLLFLGLEAVLRREPSYRMREVAQYVGLALILALMLFAFWNDLRRL